MKVTRHGPLSINRQEKTQRDEGVRVDHAADRSCDVLIKAPAKRETQEHRWSGEGKRPPPPMSKYDSDCRRQMDGLNSPRLEGHTTPLKNHIERAELDGRKENISESRWIPDTGSLLERTLEGRSRKKDDAPKTPDAERMEWMDGDQTSGLAESNTDGEWMEWMEWMDGAQTPGLAESYAARRTSLERRADLDVGILDRDSSNLERTSQGSHICRRYGRRANSGRNSSTNKEVVANLEHILRQRSNANLDGTNHVTSGEDVGEWKRR